MDLLPLSAQARDAVKQARDGSIDGEGTVGSRLSTKVRSVLAAISPLPRPTQAKALESFAIAGPNEATQALLKLIRLARDDRTLLGELVVISGACAEETSLLIELADDPGLRFLSVDLSTRRTLVTHLARLAGEKTPPGSRSAVPRVLADCLSPLSPSDAPPAPEVTPLGVATVAALLLQHPGEYARLTAALYSAGKRARTATGVELPKVETSGVLPRVALEAALAKATPRSTAEGTLQALTKLPYRRWSGGGAEFLRHLGTLLERVTAAELPACLVLSAPRLGTQAFVRLANGELELYGLGANGQRMAQPLPWSGLAEGGIELLAPVVLIEDYLAGKTLPSLERTVDPMLHWYAV